MKKYIKPSVKAVEIEITGALCEPSDTLPVGDDQGKGFDGKYGAWSKEDFDDDEDLW